jgi:AraC-like DNA-binding protein
MKVLEIKLPQDQDKSFIVYHETNVFPRLHYHHEFELVYISTGRGRRMVGDHIDRFDTHDMVLVGTYLPHEWVCDKEFYPTPDSFTGEGFVIHFKKDFLGKQFFNLQENRRIDHILTESSRGLLITGETRNKIIPIIIRMLKMNAEDRLFALFRIFNVLSKMNELTLLSSPGFKGIYHSVSNDNMKKALDIIMKDFQTQISIRDMVKITNMSSSAFYKTFKRTYRTSFKDYLQNTRIGYACKLFIDEQLSISEIAYQSGFANISNFNRQFKKIKGITPTEYRDSFIKE